MPVARASAARKHGGQGSAHQALGQVGADNGVRDGEILISGHLCMLRQAAPMLSEEDLLRLRLASTQTPHFVHLNSAELTYSQDKGVLIKIEDIKVEEIIGVVSHDPNVKPFQKELSVSHVMGSKKTGLDALRSFIVHGGDFGDAGTDTAPEPPPKKSAGRKKKGRKHGDEGERQEETTEEQGGSREPRRQKKPLKQVLAEKAEREAKERAALADEAELEKTSKSPAAPPGPAQSQTASGEKGGARGRDLGNVTGKGREVGNGSGKGQKRAKPLGPTPSVVVQHGAAGGDEIEGAAEDTERADDARSCQDSEDDIVETKKVVRMKKVLQKRKHRLLLKRALRVWRKGEAPGDDASWRNRLTEYALLLARREQQELKDGKETEAEGRNAAPPASNAIFWRPCAGFRETKLAAYKMKLGFAEFAVVTSPIGPFRGRTYLFKASTQAEQEKWVETIGRAVAASARRNPGPPVRATRLHIMRSSTRVLYFGDRCQMLVAALIMGNFAINLAEAQVPATTENVQTFARADLAFTMCFLFELLMNMFATLWTNFFKDPWNWFDLLCVVISMMSLFVPNLPGADILRLLRCFRVFRLFKRIDSFRNIIVSLGASIKPMCNAFVIVCLVIAIYAIVGVIFFRELAPSLFGSFFPAFFSLFQSMTGDAWSEHCRDLMLLAIASSEDKESRSGQQDALWVVVYYVSFVLVVSLVLVNVVMVMSQYVRRTLACLQSCDCSISLLTAVLLGAFADASAEYESLKSSHQMQSADENGCKDEESKAFDNKALQERLPFHRMTDDLNKLDLHSDVMRKIGQLFTQIAVGGLVRTEDAVCPLLEQEEAAAMEAARKEVLTLKRVLRIWREGPIVSWTLSAEEFRFGLRALDYLPPITITPTCFERYVTNPGYTNKENRLSIFGFQRLMADHMKRHLMSNLAKCEWQCSQHGDEWSGDSIAAAGRALSDICRCVNDGSGLDRFLSVVRPGMWQVSAFEKVETDRGWKFERVASAEWQGTRCHERWESNLRNEEAEGDEVDAEMTRCVVLISSGLKRLGERLNQLLLALECKRNLHVLQSNMEKVEAMRDDHGALIVPQDSSVNQGAGGNEDGEMAEADTWDEAQVAAQAARPAGQGKDSSEEKGTGGEDRKQRDRARAIFDAFDADESGKWEVEEFEDFLCEKDPAAASDVQRIFDSIDSEDSGTIDFDQFYSWFVAYRAC